VFHRARSCGSSGRTFRSPRSSVLDERSPLHGFDMLWAIKADVQVFAMIQARDPTLATMVHDIRNYAAEDIRFGMRYRDAVTTSEDGTPVLDLTKIGALEPDVGDRQEQGCADGKKNGKDAVARPGPGGFDHHDPASTGRRWIVRRHGEGKHAVANAR
jgi:hypothetical protein